MPCHTVNRSAWSLLKDHQRSSKDSLRYSVFSLRRENVETRITLSPWYCLCAGTYLVTQAAAPTVSVYILEILNSWICPVNIKLICVSLRAWIYLNSFDLLLNEFESLHQRLTGILKKLTVGRTLCRFFTQIKILVRPCHKIRAVKNQKIWM
jgi:hypothetical protein